MESQRNDGYNITPMHVKLHAMKLTLHLNFQLAGVPWCLYSASYKSKVIGYVENQNNCATARHFGVSESNVRLWKKN